VVKITVPLDVALERWSPCRSTWPSNDHRAARPWPSNVVLGVSGPPRDPSMVVLGVSSRPTPPKPLQRGDQGPQDRRDHDV